jgi:hypothetical protein
MVNQVVSVQIGIGAAPDVVGLVTTEHGGAADLPGECSMLFNTYA